MKVAATMQLQTGDVLGMIASHLTKKYGKKVTGVTPVLNDVKVFDRDNNLSHFERKLSHFEVSFEDEISDTFGE